LRVKDIKLYRSLIILFSLQIIKTQVGGMDNAIKTELTDYLLSFISEKRKARFQEVLSNRSDHLRVVLENVYQDHNASAVLRSCESFGVQHVHFIENRNKLRISEDVSMGSHKWLNIHRHSQSANNSIEAINTLKAQGYRIVATTPHKNDCSIEKLPVDKKLALVFGTELEGISQDVFDLADEFVKIPMYGFTESFNVSVCAAICLYELTTRIRATAPNYLLSEQDKLNVYFEWLKNSVDKSDMLIKDYLNKKKI
jgi:tRNA (guanosine-2'-O-)-methyltransferase